MTGISRGPGMSTLVSVQYLRACAAIMVVYYHIFSSSVAERWSGGRDAGQIGVDIFFVISGFIMWISTGHQRNNAVKFLRRRAIRVYPMWWLALTVWIVSRLVIPDRLHNADVTLHSVITSYLLIPHFHTVFSGRIWPILVPGWTLQLEIFFYLLFGLTLLIVGQMLRLAVIIAMLCALTIFGLVLAPQSALLSAYTSPLLLEFGTGILFAALLPVLQKTPWMAGAAAIAIGVIYVAVCYHSIVDHGLARVLVLGIPAAFIFAGALVLEPVLSRSPRKLWLLLGDSSYSLYLIHPVAISAAAVIWKKLHLPSGDSIAVIGFLPFALALSLVIAVAMYKWIETPLLDRFLYTKRGAHHAPSLPAATLAEDGLGLEAPAIILPVPEPRKPV